MAGLLQALGWLLSATPWGISWLTLITLVFALIVTLILVLLSRVPLSYNLNNLRVRWKNTGMTALAFTLVLSVLTLMLAFVAVNAPAFVTRKGALPGVALPA